eukprot:SAG11_NODE_11836_length_736_cov_0.877551_2_plen_149_part_01
MEDCEQLIELAEASGTIAAAAVNWKDDSDLSRGNADWRSADSAWLAKQGRSTDPLVEKLNARAAALLRAPVSVVAGGNSLQVARYTAGQHYWPHFDSRHLADLGGKALETHLQQMGGDAANTAALRRIGGFPYAARYATLLYFLRAPTA